jgi:hypothetical protein
MAINFNSFTTGTVGGANPIQSDDYVVGFDTAVPSGERKWQVTTLANAVSAVMNDAIIEKINQNSGDGTVTSVTGTSPIVVATGTTTPAISIAANSITASHIAPDAITSSELAANSVTNSKLDASAISGQTAITSAADADSLLILDDTVLKKITIGSLRTSGVFNSSNYSTVGDQDLTGLGSYTFTGIPTTAREIKLIVSGIQTDQSTFNNIEVRLGNSAGIIITGYLGAGSIHSASSAGENSTSGFNIYNYYGPNQRIFGILTIRKLDESSSGAWIASGSFGTADTGYGTTMTTGGRIFVSSLDRLRITVTQSGKMFTGGSVNIVYY